MQHQSQCQPKSSPQKAKNKNVDKQEYQWFQNWINANNALSASRPIRPPPVALVETLVMTTPSPRKLIPTISPAAATIPSVKANLKAEDDQVLTVSDVKPQANIKTFTPPATSERRKCPLLHGQEDQS